jgi:NurA-like 5'-3' nuclease
VDLRPVLVQLEHQHATLADHQVAANERLDRLAAQQRRLADTLAEVQEQNVRMQQEQRGLRGAITVLTMVSGVAMVFVAAAIVLLVTQVIFKP